MREQWIYEIHKRKGRLHGMYKNAKIWSYYSEKKLTTLTHTHSRIGKEIFYKNNNNYFTLTTLILV